MTLPPLELVPPGTLRDRLNDQVLRGAKTATSRLMVMDEMSGTPAEPVGTRLRLLDSDGHAAAAVEITRIEVLRFDEVGAEVSEAEGEWMVDPADWRAAHTRYWNSRAPEIREYLGDETWELTGDALVVVRFFRLLR